MNNSKADAQTLAKLLLSARTTGKPVARPDHFSLSMAQAVRNICIETLTTDKSLAVCAYKVSLSTGTWGALSSDTVFVGEATLSRAAFNDPLLEGEIAFLAQADLEPGCTIQDVLNQCLIAPAIEIADSRWENWCPSNPDRFVIPSAEEIEADNAVAGILVIGQPWVRSKDVVLGDLTVEMRSGGRSLASAPFWNVMGTPAKAVSWLVDRLALEGRSIRRGQIVSAGCPHEDPVTVPREGGHWSAVIEGLGTASVTFT